MLSWLGLESSKKESIMTEHTHDVGPTSSMDLEANSTGPSSLTILGSSDEHIDKNLKISVPSANTDTQGRGSCCEHCKFHAASHTLKHTDSLPLTDGSHDKFATETLFALEKVHSEVLTEAQMKNARPQKSIPERAPKAELLQDNLRRTEKTWLEQTGLLRKQIGTLESQLLAQSRELDRRELITEELKDQVEALKKASFLQIDDPLWISEPNSAIISKLNSLDADLKRWSKENTLSFIREAQDRLSGEDRNHFFTDLLESTQSVGRPEANALINTLTAKGKLWVALNAILSDFVYRRYFKSPFFFADAWATTREKPANETLPSFDFSWELNMMYRHTATVNAPEAWSWRSQLLRLLMPKTPIGSQEMPAYTNIRTMTRNALEDTSDKAAQRFRAHRGWLLLKDPISEKAKEKLLEIFDRAANLSYELWAQKRSVQIYDMDSFRSPDTKMVRFNSAQSLMEPHALHSRDLERKPAALEGKMVLLLIHPAVTLTSLPQVGEKPIERLVKKAICWMG